MVNHLMDSSIGMVRFKRSFEETALKPPSSILLSDVHTLFRQMSKCGQIKCNAPGHKECIQYRVWKKRHPLQHRNLVDRAANSPRFAFIPHPAILKVFERQVRIEGGIMSIVPPCLGVADAHGNHPYTCVNCAKQLRDLKENLRKRKSAVYGQS